MYAILLSVVSELKSYSPEATRQTRESNSKQQTITRSSHSSLPDRIMQLQKSIGNQAVLQLMRDNKQDQVFQRKKNETGLPDELKAGLENLSGMDMSDVKVHYQSDKPRQIGALAYAQGTDIHLGPGQEHHLPHEGWHVVQQMQGRVKPTLQMKAGVQINDEFSLEKEADQMGAQALRMGISNPDVRFSPRLPPSLPPAIRPIQGVWASVQGTAAGKLNLKTLTGERSSSGKQLYSLSRTGDLYEEVSYVHGDLVVKPYDPSTSTSVIHSIYENWTTGQTTNLSIDTEFGPVAARHNRGAPYITSREEDYNNAKLGTTYESFISGLRNGTNDDSEDAVLAQALLDNDTTELTTDLQHRAAAMLNTTVYLAEEWRKQGAGKIFRALLRQVIHEEITFDDFLHSFRFIASADEGRRQVARFQDVIDEELDYDDLDEDEQGIYDNMSEVEDDDFSSDDEMREDKELKKPRLFAARYQQ